MYAAHFKLSCFPFKNTLGQRFLFMSGSHEEVIAALLYFVSERKSFAFICGDVGTGKTMLVRHFLGKLPGSVVPILLPYPDVEYIELLGYIARVLGLETERKGVLQLSDEVAAKLSKTCAQGKRVVLIIDEAHLLPVSSLENIRLLSNIELAEHKLLQILLIGQSELALKLQKPELRQLRQRITINRVLLPMTQAETIRYIDFRLRVAGSSFAACFNPGTERLLTRLTGGVPRNINRLCDTACLICMMLKTPKVTKAILRKAHKALESDSILRGQKIANRFWAKHYRYTLTAAALSIFLAAGFFPINTARRPVKTLESLPGAYLHPAATIEKEQKGAKAVIRSAQKNALTSPPPAQTHSKPPPLPRDLPELGKPAQQPLLCPAAAVPPGGTKEEPKESLRPEFKTIFVKKGDSLSRIAARFFPNDPASGLKRILQANPQVRDKDLILIDQSLNVPQDEPDKASFSQDEVKQ
jgi:general secretion pathway protein A